MKYKFTIPLFIFIWGIAACTTPTETDNWQEYNSALDLEVSEFLDNYGVSNTHFSVKFPQGWETGWAADSDVIMFVLSSGDVHDTWVMDYAGPAFMIIPFGSTHVDSPDVNTLLYEMADDFFGVNIGEPVAITINGQDTAKAIVKIEVTANQSEVRLVALIVKENVSLFIFGFTPVGAETESLPIFEAILNTIVISLE